MVAADRQNSGPDVPPNVERINVDRGTELRYWASKWGCTKQDIFICEREVGPMAEDIEACLRRKGLIQR